MKILHVGNAPGTTDAARFYLTPQRLINGFTRNGHTVVVFNDRVWARFASLFRTRKLGYRKVDRKFLDICTEYRPDLVFLSNCEMVSNEAISEIKRRLSGTKVAYRNVDSLDLRHNRDKILRRVGVVDAIFVTSDVSALDPGDPATRLAFMPNPVDASLDTARAFARADFEHDLFFAGNASRDRADPRSALLRTLMMELSDLRLGFFGTAVGRAPVVGQDYLDRLGASKMGLSLDRDDANWLYASDRMSHYLGNGLLTFVRRGKGFERFFSKDEIAWFDEADDLIESIRRFARDDDARRRMAEAGWRLAHAEFSSDAVASWIVETTFGLPAQRRYLWAES